MDVECCHSAFTLYRHYHPGTCCVQLTQTRAAARAKHDIFSIRADAGTGQVVFSFTLRRSFIPHCFQKVFALVIPSCIKHSSFYPTLAQPFHAALVLVVYSSF